MMPAMLEISTDTAITDTPPPQLDHDEIEGRAYFRYLDRGCGDGFALDDWIAADNDLREETTSDPAATS